MNTRNSMPKKGRSKNRRQETLPQTLARWSTYLQKTLHQTHLYQVQALAAFSFAAARARHCHLSILAAQVPVEVQPSSVIRRLHRFLGNPRLDVEALCDEMACWLTRWNRSQAQLTLLLDETPHFNNWRVLKVSVAYHHRALPLVWRTDPLAGRSQKQRVRQVLEQAATLVQRYAPGAQVTLLADRGLCWSDTIGFCREKKWHFLMRAQSLLTFRWCDRQGQSQHCTLQELAREQGSWFKGQGEAFAKSKWLPVNVVACWMHKSQECWLLVTDLEPSLFLVRRYAKRVWQEESFRDEKSQGFHWDKSHVSRVERVHRLLLILALAQLWLSWLGTLARDTACPWCHKLGLTCTAQRRRWSIVRAGWHLLLLCLNNNLPTPCTLAFTPP